MDLRARSLQASGASSAAGRRYVDRGEVDWRDRPLPAENSSTAGPDSLQAVERQAGIVEGLERAPGRPAEATGGRNQRADRAAGQVTEDLDSAMPSGYF